MTPLEQYLALLAQGPPSPPTTPPPGLRFNPQAPLDPSQVQDLRTPPPPQGPPPMTVPHPAPPQTAPVPYVFGHMGHAGHMAAAAAGRGLSGEPVPPPDEGLLHPLVRRFIEAQLAKTGTRRAV